MKVKGHSPEPIRSTADLKSIPRNDDRDPVASQGHGPDSVVVHTTGNGHLYYKDDDGAIYELRQVQGMNGKIQMSSHNDALDEKLRHHFDDDSIESSSISSSLDSENSNWVRNFQKVTPTNTQYDA